MKTPRDIIRDIEQLQASSQTLQPRDVLQQVMSLAMAVENLRQSLPHDATDDVLNDPPNSN